MFTGVYVLKFCFSLSPDKLILMYCVLREALKEVQ